MLLKGLISTIKSRQVRNAGAGGGLRLKIQKALEGLLKIADDDD